MIEKVVFFNTWYYGDMHASKAFVKNFCKYFEEQSVETVYATDNNHHAVNLPMHVTHLAHFDQRIRSCPPSFFSDGTMYINIWVGHYMIAQEHNFVNQIKMWRDISAKIIAQSSGNIVIPVVEDTWSTVAEIEEQLLNKIEIPEGPNVLICNNSPISLPTIETDLKLAVEKLALKFPNVNFICSKNVSLKMKNVFYCEDLIDNKNGNDLPEIGYLASKMDVVLSNCSGPGTYALNKQSFSNDRLDIITVTPSEQNTFWYGVDNVKANTLWSPNGSDENIFNLISAALDEKQL